MAESGFVDVTGGRLYYEVEGEGHPLTLIHAGIANLRMWDAQVPVFAQRYRVVRYDTRGFGRTTTEDVAFSNRQDLADLLDHLGIDSTYLMGSSRGGIIATDFTVERPERVDALIGVSTMAGGFEPPDVPAELSALWQEMERLEQAGDWEPLSEMETALWVDGPGQSRDRVDPELRRRVYDWILENHRLHGHEKAKAQPLDPPAFGRLSQLDVPALVLWGDLEPPDGVASGQALADHLPGARRFVFSGAAHLPSMEQPELFNRVVLEFLEEVDARRASGEAARAPAAR